MLDVTMNRRGDAITSWVQGHGAQGGETLKNLWSSFRPAGSPFRGPRTLVTEAWPSLRAQIAVDEAGNATAVWAGSATVSATFKPFGKAVEGGLPLVELRPSRGAAGCEDAGSGQRDCRLDPGDQAGRPHPGGVLRHQHGARGGRGPGELQGAPSAPTRSSEHLAATSSTVSGATISSTVAVDATSCTSVGATIGSLAGAARTGSSAGPVEIGSRGAAVPTF